LVQYTRDSLSSKFDQYALSIGDFTYGVPLVHCRRTDCELVIGRYCSIAGGVNIFLGNDHHIDWVTAYPFSDLLAVWPTAAGTGCNPVSKGDVCIGSDVWIGSFATIMSGVAIGHGAVIAAHAVVTKDVPPYGIAMGNPARVVRTRFSPEIVQRLLRVRWWDWPAERVAEAIPLMLNTELTAFLDRYDPEAPADASEALPSPVTEGLIASLDFGQARTLDAEWGNIAACNGADNTTVRAIQPEATQRPVRIWKKGRYAARFIAANRQYLDLTSLLENHADVFAGPHSIVCLIQLNSLTSACVVDVARADGTVTGPGANRSSLIANGNTNQWCFRQGGRAVDAISPDPIELERPEILVGCRTPSGSIALTRGGVCHEPASNPSQADAPNVATIGARTIGGVKSMFLDGYVWRLLIYSRLLSPEEIEKLTQWGQSALV
jgi:chloramphenicol O-acetyltransferase type B